MLCSAILRLQLETLRVSLELLFLEILDFYTKLTTPEGLTPDAVRGFIKLSPLYEFLIPENHSKVINYTVGQILQKHLQLHNSQD